MGFNSGFKGLIYINIRFNYKIPKGGYTLVTLPRIVTPYRDSVEGTRDRVTYQSLLRGNITDLFGVLSVFGRRIKGMIRLRP